MSGYRLSHKADEDLIHIYVEGVVAFGVAQAERYHDALEAAFEAIGSFPEIARERPEFIPPVRIHRCRSHVIIYVIDESGPFIIRVRHGSEDWASGATSNG